MNCPICNKTGLPDYTKEPVICPQCNSNLKGYLLLEETKSIHKNIIKKQNYIYGALIFIFIIGLLTLVLYSSDSKKEFVTTLQKQEFKINNLTTDIKEKNKEIDSLNHIVKKLNIHQKVSVLYVVKKGDNLSKIAYIFYNDWRLYNKIKEDNNIKQGDVLYPNDTLIINLNIQ